MSELFNGMDSYGSLQELFIYICIVTFVYNFQMFLYISVAYYNCMSVDV